MLASICIAWLAQAGGELRGFGALFISENGWKATTRVFFSFSFFFGGGVVVVEKSGCQLSSLRSSNDVMETCLRVPVITRPSFKADRYSSDRTTDVLDFRLDVFRRPWVCSGEYLVNPSTTGHSKPCTIYTCDLGDHDS